MNRKVAIVISAIILGSVAGLVLFGQSFSLFNQQRFEVSNLRLTYGSQTMYGFNMGSSPQAVISFTVRNLHSSPMTTVGLTLNGISHGLSTLQVPPGQMQDESLPLSNMALSSSTTYPVDLTFTFADGKYQTYSGSYTTPQFRGQADVTKVSLDLGTFLSYFHVEIKNTGNLPITGASCTFGGIEAFFLSQYAMPGESLTGGFNGIASSLFKAGMAYSVKVQLTYVDGSESTLQTSVTAMPK